MYRIRVDQITRTCMVHRLDSRYRICKPRSEATGKNWTTLDSLEEVDKAVRELEKAGIACLWCKTCLGGVRPEAN